MNSFARMISMSVFSFALVGAVGCGEETGDGSSGNNGGGGGGSTKTTTTSNSSNSTTSSSSDSSGSTQPGACCDLFDCPGTEVVCSCKTISGCNITDGECGHCYTEADCDDLC